MHVDWEVAIVKGFPIEGGFAIAFFLCIFAKETRIYVSTIVKLWFQRVAACQSAIFPSLASVTVFRGYPCLVSCYS
jgi:hypothetical protein